MEAQREREGERGVIYAELEEMIERVEEGGRKADRQQTSRVIYAELWAPTENCV